MAETIHTNNIQTEQFEFMYLEIYMDLHIDIYNNEK